MPETDSLYNYQNVSPAKESFGIKEFVGDFAKFTVGTLALGFASKWAAGKVLGRVSDSVLRASITANMRGAKGMAGLVQGFTRTAMTEAATMREAGVGEAVIRTLSSAGRIGQSFGKYGQVISAGLKNSRVVGAQRVLKAATHVYKALPAYTSWYAVDKLTSTRPQEQQRSWYNIPGHMADYVKSIGEYAMFDGAVSVGRGAFGFARSRVASYLHQNYSESAKPGMHDFLDKFLARRGKVGESITDAAMGSSLRFLSKLHSAKGFLSGFSEEINSGMKRLYDNARGRSASFAPHKGFTSAEFWKDTLNHAMSKAQSAGKNFRQGFSKNSYPHEMMRELGKMVEMSYGVNLQELNQGQQFSALAQRSANTPKTITLNVVKEILNDYKRVTTKGDIGVTTFGRVRARGEDVLSAEQRTFASQAIQRLRDVSADEATQKAWTRVEARLLKGYAGPGLYKRGLSGVVDYSMYNPGNFLRSAYGFFNAATSFNVPFSERKIEPLEILGFKKLMGKSGLNIYTPGYDERHVYRDQVSGHFNPLNPHKRGDLGLRAIYVGGKLFASEGESGALRQVDQNLHMIALPERSKYRDVITNMVDTDHDMVSQIDMAIRDQKFLYGTSSPEGAAKLVSMGQNLLSWLGLKLPDPARHMVAMAKNAMGGGNSAMARTAVDVIFGTTTGTYSDKLQTLYHLREAGEVASINAYHTLSRPKALAKMADIAGSRGAKGGDLFREISQVLNGGSDAELIELATKHKLINDPEIERLKEVFYSEGKLPAVVKRGNRIYSRWTSGRDEIGRKLINCALSGKANDEETVMNMAAKLLKDKEFMSGLSRDEVSDLTMMSASFDLYHVLPQRGRIAAFSDSGNVVSKATEILKNNYSDNQQILLEHLSKRNLTSFGGFGSALRGNYKEDYFQEALTSAYGGIHGGATYAQSPYIFVHKDRMPSFYFKSLFDKFMDLGDVLGIKFGVEERIRNRGITIPIWGKTLDLGAGGNMMLKRVAQGVGTFAALQAADTFLDVNPLFAGTMFHDGLWTGMAEMAMKSSLAFHKAKDIFGVTSTAKYLEGLFPYSTTSIPGAIIGGMNRGPIGAVAGAVVNRFISPVLPDLDKSYEEMKEIYSGRELVPVKKGRWWLFSKSPMEGMGTEYYRPHFLARARSQYKYTQTLWGSKMEAFIYKPWPLLGVNPIGHFIDKYHYERKHYYDRPYPYTSAAFSDMPGIGPLIAGTIGRLPIIGKPVLAMHKDEMEHYYSEENQTVPFGEYAQSKVPRPLPHEQIGYMGKSLNPNSLAATELRGGKPQMKLNPYAMQTLMGEQVYNMTEIFGLQGFLAESVMGGAPADMISRYSSAKDMMSTRRAFWDLNLGDVMFTTEFLRRFVPREKGIWKKENPLRNRMPSWLPGGSGSDYFIDFLTGDPFTKVKEGEIRLPGQAYSTLYNVRDAFPGRASALGKNIGDLVRWMTGLENMATLDEEEIMESGTDMHKAIMENLLNANLALKTEEMVYDAKSDVAGFIDVILRDPIQKNGRPLEIKTVSSKVWASVMKKPKWTHTSQLNFYLKQLGARVGTLLYINRDDPSQVKTYDVRYSKERFRKDLADLEKARAIAAGVLADGKGYEDGSSYSWLDRMRILADVAPYSKQYETAAKIVGIQLRVGKLSEKDKEEVIKIKKHRQNVARKYDLYPVRFRGKVFNPDTNYQLLSDNQNLKAAAEYSFAERGLGSLWERMLQLNTPINTKFFFYRTPIQHYQRTRLYGTESGFWNKPWSDFVRPMLTQSRDDPVAAGYLGYTLGGGYAGAALGALGGIGSYLVDKAVGDDTWIPGAIREKRQIEAMMDEAKYLRALQLYNETGDKKYITESEETMYGIRSKGYKVGMKTIMRSLSNMDKPFFFPFLGATDPEERKKILQMVPEDIGRILAQKWGNKELSEMVATNRSNIEDSFQSSIMRSNWEGFLPDKTIESVKIKTVEDHGFDAHDWGMGWYEQQRQINNSPYSINPVHSLEESVTLPANNIDVNGLRKALTAVLSRYSFRPLISIMGTPGDSDVANIKLKIRRDRRREISQFLKGY